MATLRKRRRKLKDGVATSWVVDFSVTEGGKTRRKQEHFRVDPNDLHRARLLAEQRKGEIDRRMARRKLRNEHGLDGTPRDVEVGNWLDAFARAVRPNCGPKYHDGVVQCCKEFWRFMAEHGAFTTTQLRRQHFSDYVEDMQGRGLDPKTIHNKLAILKRAVRWGIDEGYLEAMLVRSFPSVKVPAKKRRVLSKDEIEELLSAAEGTEIHELILVAIYTGARRGELVQLLCSDVDLQRGVVSFRGEVTKTGESGEVPIHPRIRPVLQDKAEGGGYLLVRPNGQPWSPDAITRRFRRLVREKLHWTDVSFHCLRHTFGTQLAASGQISPFELQKLMRHKTITTSMIYVNLANQDLPDIDVF